MARLFFSQKLLSGETHFFVWRVVARLVGLANTALILSSLTLYQYGVLQLLLSLFAIVSEFSSPAGGAVANAIQRLVGKGREGSAKRLFLEDLAVRALVSATFFLVFFFGASLLAARYQENFIIFFRALAFLFITEFLLLSAHGLLRIRLAFREIASRGAVRKTAQFAVLLLFYALGNLGVVQVIFSMMLASLASCVVLIPALIRHYGVWRSVRAERAWIITRVFAAEGKWEIVRSAFHGIASNAHPFAIKLTLGTEAVGVYNAALALAGIFKGFVISSTLDVLLANVAHERERMRLIFTRGAKYIAAVSGVVALVGAALGAGGVLWFFPAYRPALPLFFILVALIPLHALRGIAGTYLTVLRKQKFSFVQSATRDAARLALIVALLPILHLFALPLIEAVILTSSVIASYRYLHSRYPDLRVTPHHFFRYAKEDKVLLAMLWHTFSGIVRGKLNRR